MALKKTPATKAKNGKAAIPGAPPSTAIENQPVLTATTPPPDSATATADTSVTESPTRVRPTPTTIETSAQDPNASADSAMSGIEATPHVVDKGKCRESTTETPHVQDVMDREFPRLPGTGPVILPPQNNWPAPVQAAAPAVGHDLEESTAGRTATQYSGDQDAVHPHLQEGPKRLWAGSPPPEEISRAEPRPRTESGSLGNPDDDMPDLAGYDEIPDDDDDLYAGPPPGGVTYHGHQLFPLGDDGILEPDLVRSSLSSQWSPAPLASQLPRLPSGRTSSAGSRLRGTSSGRLYTPMARHTFTSLGSTQTSQGHRDYSFNPPTAGPSAYPRAPRNAASTSLPLFDPSQFRGASTPSPHTQLDGSMSSNPQSRQAPRPPLPPFTFQLHSGRSTAPMDTRAETPALFRQPPPDARFEMPQGDQSRPGDYREQIAHGGQARDAPWPQNTAYQARAGPANQAHDLHTPTLGSPRTRAPTVDYRAFQTSAQETRNTFEEDASTLRPAGVTAGGDSQPALTPRPPGGWPVVHRSDPEEPFNRMPLHRVQEAWEVPRNAMLFSQVYNVGGVPQTRAARELSDAIAATILHVTDELPYVVAPEASDRGNSNVFIINGLSAAAAEQVLDIGLLSTPEVSFSVFNRDLHIPQHVLALGSITGGTQASIESMVRWNLAGPLRHTITTLVERNPTFAGITTDEAIQRILDTLRVRLLTMNNGNTIANVFISSPTRSIALWREWVTQLRAHAWRDRNHSTVYARRVTLCLGCHSADHPTHLCPCPHTPGWNGPMAGTGSHSTLAPPPPPPPSSPGPSSMSRGRNTAEDASRGGFRGSGRGRGRGHGR